MLRRRESLRTRRRLHDSLISPLFSLYRMLINPLGIKEK